MLIVTCIQYFAYGHKSSHWENDEDFLGILFPNLNGSWCMCTDGTKTNGCLQTCSTSDQWKGLQHHRTYDESRQRLQAIWAELRSHRAPYQRMYCSPCQFEINWVATENNQPELALKRRDRQCGQLKSMYCIETNERKNSIFYIRAQKQSLGQPRYNAITSDARS
jgi:hypothetical protein